MKKLLSILCFVFAFHVGFGQKTNFPKYYFVMDSTTRIITKDSTEKTLTDTTVFIKVKQCCCKNKKQCFSNNPSNEIKLNFEDKSMVPSRIYAKDIKKGEYFQFKIDNLNQNLYKVSVTTSDSIAEKQLTMPTFTDPGLSAISSITDKLTSAFIQITQNKDNGNNGGNGIVVDGVKNSQFSVNYTQLMHITKSLDSIKQGLDSTLLNLYLMRLQAISARDTQESLSITDEVKDFSQLRMKLYVQKMELEASKDKFKNKCATEAKADTNKVKAIYAKYTSLSAIIDTCLKIVSAENVFSLLETIVILNNNASNIYTSLPIQYNGDLIKIKYKIEPRDSKYLLQTYEGKITLPTRRTYAAVGGSFFCSKLYDEAYSQLIVPTSDSTQNTTPIPEDWSQFEIGFASMFKFGCKIRSSDVGLHATIGPGFTISKTIKPRLLLGGGLSYGNRHNISLDFGCIAGPVDVLSKTVNANETVDYALPESVVVSKLKFSRFISLGYFYTF